MKFSILGFSQKGALSLSKMAIDKNGKEKTIQLDVADLLILQEISDFMNRKKIIKYNIDDKTFFSVQYSVILEDLPILGIKKQALSDRIDKMVNLGIIEKNIVKNQAGSFSAFRLTEKYEDLVYQPTSSELQVQTYSTTSANVVNYKPKDNTTNTTSTKTIKKENTKVYKTAKTNWRADIEVYRHACDEALNILAEDKECEASLVRLHPNVDYYRSLLKSLEFWKTEKGWEYKKRSKSTNINMVATIKKNLEKNIVYQRKEDAPIQNERLLHIRMVDKEEGTLIDGTVFKNGYRYYFSNKEGRSCSIPVDAPERVDDRWEWSNKKGWYLPEDKETAEDLSW